jgi:hypothetical protein
MNEKWKQIWETKSIRDDVNISLGQLISANGFDPEIGSYNEELWRQMVADLCFRISLLENSNVL